MSEPEPRTLTGTCAFRLMPDHELAQADSTVTIMAVGAGQHTVTYTWIHPDDGPQFGSLLVGAASDEGDAVTAAWGDTWHQKPALLTLTGTRTGEGVDLAASYAGDWGWQIALTGLDGDAPEMVMRNVVPESALAMAPPDAPPMSAGPYDVMVAAWR